MRETYAWFVTSGILRWHICFLQTECVLIFCLNNYWLGWALCFGAVHTQTNTLTQTLKLRAFSHDRFSTTMRFAYFPRSHCRFRMTSARPAHCAQHNDISHVPNTLVKSGFKSPAHLHACRRRHQHITAVIHTIVCSEMPAPVRFFLCDTERCMRNGGEGTQTHITNYTRTYYISILLMWIHIYLTMEMHNMLWETYEEMKWKWDEV